MTYNSNAPMGFVPVRKLDGSAWSGQLTQYNIASAYNTAIGTGDPVTQLSDGTIGIGVAGSPILGIFMGCKYPTASGQVNAPNWVANTATLGSVQATALVLDDPNVVFTVQETSSTGTAGTPLALADRNLNINFVIGAPNSTTGVSTTSLNNETENTTPTLNCRILDLDPNPSNAVGAFANWLVSINNHLYKGGGGTSGV